jgi:hypothetical protein
LYESSSQSRLHSPLCQLIPFPHFRPILNVDVQLLVNEFVKDYWGHFLPNDKKNLIDAMQNETKQTITSTPNVDPTLFVIPCNLLGGLDLQCCNYYHLPNYFTSKFQSCMTMFHHKLLIREGRVLANG